MKKRKIKFSGDLVLHLGFPKTGTMALQNEIFPEIDGAYYLGMSANVKSPKTYQELTLNLHPQGTQFSPRLEDTLDWVESIGFTKVLLSHVYPTNPDNLLKIRDVSQFLDLLDERISSYKLLFTVRTPSKLLESLYLHESNGLDEGAFDRWFFSSRIQHFVSFLDYSYIESECVRRHIPVLLLKQEHLMRRRRDYICELADFVGISISDAALSTGTRPHLRQSEIMKLARLRYRRLPKFLRVYGRAPTIIKGSVEKLLNFGARQRVDIGFEALSQLKILDATYENLD